MAKISRSCKGKVYCGFQTKKKNNPRFHVTTYETSEALDFYQVLGMLPGLRVATSGCRGFATHASVRGFSGAIGNTPLVSPLSVLPTCCHVLKNFQILIKGLSEKIGSRIYAKAEFQNPGGSVKDRAALGLVRDAEERGLYDPHLHRFSQSNLVLTNAE